MPDYVDMDDDALLPYRNASVTLLRNGGIGSVRGSDVLSSCVLLEIGLDWTAFGGWGVYCSWDIGGMVRSLVYSVSLDLRLLRVSQEFDWASWM